MMRRIGGLVLFSLAMALTSGSACSHTTTPDTLSPEEALTQGIEFGFPVTTKAGQLPPYDPKGPLALPPPGSPPMMVSPGDSIGITVHWTGGTATQVNVGFGGSRYFNLAVPGSSQTPSGQMTIPAKVSPDVCANLAAICHQIKCYEQAGNPFGVTANQQIVLNCTGGKDCKAISAANGLSSTGAGVGGTSVAASGPVGTDQSINAAPGPGPTVTATSASATSTSSGAGGGACTTPTTLHPPPSGTKTIYCPFSGSPNIYCTKLTEKCCEPTMGTSTCEPIANACSFGATEWDCTDPADCPQATVCCSNPGASLVVNSDPNCANYATGLQGDVLLRLVQRRPDQDVHLGHRMRRVEVRALRDARKPGRRVQVAEARPATAKRGVRAAGPPSPTSVTRDGTDGTMTCTRRPARPP